MREICTLVVTLLLNNDRIYGPSFTYFFLFSV